MDDASFQELLASVREAGAILRGKKKAARRTVVEEPQAKSIRETTNLTQAQFARVLGVPVRTLQNWEQHRTRPTGPARALLKAVARDPETAIRLLAA